MKYLSIFAAGFLGALLFALLVEYDPVSKLTNLMYHGGY